MLIIRAVVVHMQQQQQQQKNISIKYKISAHTLGTSWVCMAQNFFLKCSNGFWY